MTCKSQMEKAKGACQPFIFCSALLKALCFYESKLIQDLSAATAEELNETPPNCLTGENCRARYQRQKGGCDKHPLRVWKESQRFGHGDWRL